MEKSLKVIKAVLNSLMTIIILLGVLFVFLCIIGIHPYIARSGSMEKDIKTGSLVFINKRVDYDDIKVGDIIAFTLISGEKATHRVINVTDEGLETKGDANNISDGISTTRENYDGKVIFSIPYLGYVAGVSQTMRGRLILGTLILVLFLAGIFVGEPSKEKRKQIV